MMLWTWQGVGFDPGAHRLDRSQSPFWRERSCPDIRRAYSELDAILRLPEDRAGQFIWCFTTERSAKNPFRDRTPWTIDVPRHKIPTFVDDVMWNHVIGSDYVPGEHIRKVDERKRAGEISAEQAYFEESAKAYHATFPSREECLRLLCKPTEPGEDVSALVPLPIEPSWVLYKA
jgi:hypothetical protein